MSYSAPDGHQMIYRGLDVYFNDSVYDGALAERFGFYNYFQTERCRPEIWLILVTTVGCEFFFVAVLVLDLQT